MKKIFLLAGLVLSLNAISQVPSYVPTTGLVAYYPFNGNANDVSGNGNNGTIVNTALTTDRNSLSNSAYDFDFTNVIFGQQNDEIYIPYNSILNSSNISVSVWLYPRSYYWNGNPNASTIINRFEYGYSNPNGQTWGIGFNQNSIYAAIFEAAPNNSQNNAVVNYANPLVLNTWNNIVFTYNGSLLNLYLNGILVGSTNTTLLLNTAGSSGISIGESNQANGFWHPTDGKIDDIGIWNRALTQPEITALYNSQVTPLNVPSYVPTSGLQGWWPFTGNANDQSGNGNNGTVYGSTLTTDRNGISNTAYNFDGINDYIGVTDIDLQDTATIAAWVCAVGTVGAIVDKDMDGSSNAGYVMIYNNSTYGLYGHVGWSGNANNNILPTNNFLTLNLWHHCVLTLHNGTAKIYVDGVLVYAQTGINSTTQNNDIVLFGKSVWGGNLFSGKLDDIGIWNRALTQQEITALYNGCNTCATPTNIAVASITGSKATINWTGNSCAAKYRVRYRVQGTTSWVTKVVTAPVSTKILTLLQPLTTYEYQVRTDCNSTGTIASAYSTIQTFTTICDCIKPTNLSVSNLTQTTATVSWVGNACAVKYRVQYRVQGTTTWTTKVVTAPTVTKTLTGLTANTIYEYRLRTDCNSTGTVNSGWTTTATITTTLKLEETEISSSTFYVSPNPCSTCFVSGAENESDLIVTDIVGRIVSVEYTKSENGFYINMPDASNGLYLIRNNRTGEVVKFVKE